MASSQFTLLHLSDQERTKFGRILTLNDLQQLHPREFDRLIGYLYQKQGYKVSLNRFGYLILNRNRNKQIVYCTDNAGVVPAEAIHHLCALAQNQRAVRALLFTLGSVDDAARNTLCGLRNQTIGFTEGAKTVEWVYKANSPPPSVSFVQAHSRTIERVTTILTAAIAVGMGALALLLTLGFIFVILRDEIIPIVTNVVADTTNIGLGPVPEPLILTPMAPIPIPVEPIITPMPTAIPIPTEPGAVGAIYFDSPVEINSDLLEWANAPPVLSSYRVFTGTIATAHLGTISAVWRIGWNDEFLYVAVKVYDDVHVQTQIGRGIYLGDSVEFQIDTDMSDDPSYVDGDDYIIVLSPGDFDKVPPSSYCFQGSPTGKFNLEVSLDSPLHVVKTADGYIVEAAIPWSVLELTPAPGMVVGIALNVTDNDVPGTAVQEALYSHVANRQYLQPATWGTLTLLN